MTKPANDYLASLQARAAQLTEKARLAVQMFEAQFLLGHHPASCIVNADRRTVKAWFWPYDAVRIHLYVPCNLLWEARVQELIDDGDAFVDLLLLGDPTIDAVDDEINIFPAGVLRLATAYGRPFVTFDQAPDVLEAHWDMVSCVSHERMATEDKDPEIYAREWPEQTILWQAHLAEMERRK